MHAESCGASVGSARRIGAAGSDLDSPGRPDNSLRARASTRPEPIMSVMRRNASSRFTPRRQGFGPAVTVLWCVLAGASTACAFHPGSQHAGRAFLVGPSVGVRWSQAVGRSFAGDLEARGPLRDDQQSTPRLIVIWGDTLRGRVVLDRADENATIVESLVTRAPAGAVLSGRPFFEVAMFLSADVSEGVAGDTLDAAGIDVSKAGIRGRLYSPVDGLETLFVYRTAGGADVRLVGVPGLRVLRRHGLALRSVE